MIHPKIQEVTTRIIERSKESRALYLSQMRAQFDVDFNRSHLHCGNLAHAFAGCGPTDKKNLSEDIVPNIGVITAYNDMLSAHKTFEDYPHELRKYATKHNAVVQVASGVPAMCDGVTQGQDGMELSLFSRDVIAMSTAIGLSHNMFDSVLNLGICDKIVPGLLMGSLKFGHLPVAFVPGGPMETGISNDEKARIRRDFAEGKISREELLKGESDSYHSPGTCTFYGTANSNQMLMEIMGLQLPGSSFVNPGTQLRSLLNEEIVKVMAEKAKSKKFEDGLGTLLDEKAITNGIIGLLATGGSTNHTIHIIAIANAAGIKVNWQDFSDLSKVIPLLTKVYPNGAADINHFHAAGGMGFVMHTLLENNLLHQDVHTVLGFGLEKFTQEPKIINDQILWQEGQKLSLNESILRPVTNPFSKEGGLRFLQGNIGRSIMKTSAVSEEYFVTEAPALVFKEQEDFIKEFKAGNLDKDFVAILPFQGPKQNGMPELHQLTPSLTILQKRGFKVALVTDGRMSGASGKIPAAIHVTPEARDGGLIGKIRNGDIVRVDAISGELTCLDKSIEDREFDAKDNSTVFGLGRELFTNMRTLVNSSEEGASFL
ncbi:MAG: phosphogluconate dehydratase [Crocinitomicaceae bacterium]|nr:phosphogluconate dehydratase [Crocinitomicaceae bacterium]MDG2463888.1 phosphogluconate dehydratase [Crocinitomicaceae bacterium]